MEFKRHKPLDIPTILFFISGANSKNNLRGYVKEHHQKNLILWFLILGDLHCFFHINFSDIYMFFNSVRCEKSK